MGTAVEVAYRSPQARRIVIGLLAGEPSGDNLGAGLMQALKAHLGEQSVSFIGVGGPSMQAEGLQVLADFETLVVHGFREPLLRLPALYRLYRSLAATLVQHKVDAFVGIDFNVFNLMLERRLKRQGIPTAHYVSPSVYAWRRGRTKKVAQSADKLFCLFPFEPEFYRECTVDARFIGHPLAAQITPETGSEEARQRAQSTLGLASADVTLALLPGSRSSEVRLMLQDMLQAARLLARHLGKRNQTLQVVVPCLNEARRAQVKDLAEAFADVAQLHYLGDARLPLIACDLALVKSGTSTLETMLLRRPMVVTYRLGALTFFIAKALLKTPYIAIPNILAGRMLVPELVQNAATPQAICQALLEQLDQRLAQSEYLDSFAQLHAQLAAGASGLGPSAGAALGVADLLEETQREPS